jgi:hypothetical protein
VKTIGPDKTHIDYFQTVCALNKWLNLFGIRVAERRCVVVVKTGDGQPFRFGKYYPVPVEIDTLPNPVRMVVDNHVLGHPGSDLREVLTGKKSFQEALDSSAEGELRPTTANRPDRRENTS